MANKCFKKDRQKNLQTNKKPNKTKQKANMEFWCYFYDHRKGTHYE